MDKQEITSLCWQIAY